MLNVWLVQQEQKGDTAVRQQVSDARKRLEEDRAQWVSDVMGSISRLADLDAALFRAPNLNSPAWSNGALNSSTAESSDRAASSWAGIQARHDWDYALPPAQREHGAGAAGNGTAAPQPRPGTAEAGNDNDTATQPQPGPETAAAEVESLAAEKRCARLEAVASLARQGLAAHWRAFFRDEIERTRFAATALDLTASRWAQRQRRVVGALRASWRGRDWQSTATSGGVGGDGGDSGTAGSVVRVSVPGNGAEEEEKEEDGVVRGTGAASTPSKESETSTSPAMHRGGGRVDDADTVATAHPSSTQAGGHDTSSEKGEEATLAIGDTTARTVEVEGAANGEGDGSDPTANEPDIQRLDGDGDGGDDASACLIVVTNVADCSSASGTEAAEGAAAGQLVVFVGRAMAFHTSTIRASRLENFHEENRRRRCSSFSAAPHQGQQEQRC